MIDRSHDLPLVRQAELLRLSRSSSVLRAPACAGSRACDHATDR